MFYQIDVKEMVQNWEEGTKYLMNVGERKKTGASSLHNHNVLTSRVLCDVHPEKGAKSEMVKAVQISPKCPKGGKITN